MAQLTDEQVRTFARDGYIVLRNVVPEPLLAAADNEIDHATTDEGWSRPGNRAWFPVRRQVPRCDALLRDSPAFALAEQLVSPNVLDYANNHIQVAITVPPWPYVTGGYHLDGYDGDPGPPRSPPRSFTMVAAVLLTDQRGVAAGNLWVWPGSHLSHQELFRDQGTWVFHRAGGRSSLLDPPLTLSSPVPVTGNRGDVLLAHYLLGHAKGGNTAEHVRRTVYFRLAVPGHAERWERTFLDAWTEYPPIQRMLRDGYGQA